MKHKWCKNKKADENKQSTVWQNVYYGIDFNHQFITESEHIILNMFHLLYK